VVIRELICFLCDSDLRTILAALHRRDVHPIIQFFKYCVCGVAGLIVYTSIFFFLARFVMPSLEANVADDTTRANHALINTGIAFIFSNATAYWLNYRWVFTPGRHSKINEFLSFTLLNGPGVVSGAAVQDWLIRSVGLPAWAALVGFLVPNVLINFACRRFFIFHK
jgi:putative flippase GtrA